jgi:hypothetical protein
MILQNNEAPVLYRVANKNKFLLLNENKAVNCTEVVGRFSFLMLLAAFLLADAAGQRLPNLFHDA